MSRRPIYSGEKVTYENIYSKDYNEGRTGIFIDRYDICMRSRTSKAIVLWDDANKVEEDIPDHFLTVYPEHQLDEDIDVKPLLKRLKKRGLK